MQLFLIIVLLLGGSSVVAERAVPGNALYTMKINVNENVADFFAVSPQADAEWHARAAERRLEEAATLAAEGKLTVDKKTRIEENFKRHADKVAARIEEFRARSNFEAQVDIASKFETSLKAHEAVLAKFSADGSDDTLGSLRTSIRQEIDRADRGQTDNGASIDVKTNVQSNGLLDVNGTTDVRVDVDGASNSRQTGSGCTPPAPNSYGRNACCDTKTGQWYLGSGGCATSSAI